MAKTQGLSLNPGKISGLCGRLMCCLSYENDYYAEVSKKMPKVGGEVGTPEGKAIVASVNMLKMEVKVKIDDKNGGWIYKDYPVSEIRFKKSNQPVEKDEDDEFDE
jgi:cell fate regulator YaaT (PSP1 superfamily)